MLKETAVVTALLLGAAAVVAAGGLGLEPAKGRFLVAGRDLLDPNFSKTVVLLTDYGDDGAMGVIVNWPTAAPAAELIPQVDGVGERVGTVFVGGPVSRQVMLMLVRSDDELPQAERVFADVHLSTSRALLQQVISRQVEATDLRLYSGHAGGPGAARPGGGGRRLAGPAGRGRSGVRRRSGPRLARVDAAR